MGDANFVADFTETTRTYTITWMNGETEVNSMDLAYGVAIPAQADLEDYSDGQFDYTFSEWEGYTVGMTVSEDTIFNAVFDKEDAKLYTITFKYKNIGVKTIELGFGAAINSPGDLKKRSTDEFDYIFQWIGLDENMKVTGDMIIYGEFTKVSKHPRE